MERSAQPEWIPLIRKVRSSSPMQPRRPIGASTAPPGAASMTKIIKGNTSTVEGLLSESACRTAEMYVHLEVPLLKERASVKLNVQAEKFQEVLQDMVGSLDTTLARSQAQGYASVAEAEGQGGLQDLERFREDCSRQGQKWKHCVKKLRSKTMLAVGTLEEDLTRSLHQLQALRAENEQLQEELAACKAARGPSQPAPGRSGSGSLRRSTSTPGVKVIVEQPALDRRKFHSDPPRVSSSGSATDTDGDVDYRFAYEPIKGIKVMLPMSLPDDQAAPPRRGFIDDPWQTADLKGLPSRAPPRRGFIDDPWQTAGLQGLLPSDQHPDAGWAASPPAQPTGQKRSRSLSATLGRLFRYARGTGSSSPSPEQVPRAWP